MASASRPYRLDSEGTRQSGHSLKQLSTRVTDARQALAFARDAIGTHGRYTRHGDELEALERAAKWALVAAHRSRELAQAVEERRVELEHRRRSS